MKPRVYSGFLFLAIAIAGLLALIISCSAVAAPSIPGRKYPMKNGHLNLSVFDGDRNRLTLTCDNWLGFQLQSLEPELITDGSVATTGAGKLIEQSAERLLLEFQFGSRLQMRFEIQKWRKNGIAIQPTLANLNATDVVLNEVTILGGDCERGALCFGEDALAVRLMEQGNYWGRIRPLAKQQDMQDTTGTIEPNTASDQVTGASDLVWVAYDRLRQMALVTGFTTSERWLGKIELATHPSGAVDRW
ncbi:hypothetical protein JXJ21_22430, partial [candidate division KSB1 bacterium]|nr:hypothetical protein [candidate division KSB1 bacterium]